ncbi:MAG TPA: TonB-dependent siderophore receptor [Asticcacaulis sp.]|nr:TonB-dependent siderophore receptor [Asticcacaulis sp.]
MSPIRSRKHPAGRYLTALSIMGAAALSAGVAHADVAADAPTTEITIKGHHETYKTDQVSSPKKTETLLDTPQTVSVISKELLSDQNATNLVDALRNTPGITMQLGENGNTSAGDTFQLRGFSAQSSVFLDGIRDLGAISRDTFNVEQVEVAKGPAGADIGRGASSGYINLVSKLPVGHNFDQATASLYSAGGARATLDSNIRLGETSGLRLNLMDQDITFPGRDRVKNSGYGIAPAYGVGLGTSTRFYVFGQLLHQDNVPDGGLPVIGYPGFVNSNAFIQGGKRVDRHNYYGSVNDYEKVDAALLTTKVEHDFDSGLHLTNTTRYGQTQMDRVLTGIGNNSGGYTATSADPTTWTIIRNRQRVDQDNHILANTTNLTASIETGGWTHDLSTGFELNYEQQKTLTFAVPTGATVTPANVYNPNPNDVMATPLPTGAYSDGDATTVSGYVFETAKHGKWLLSAGLRVDAYTIKTNSATVTTATSNPPLPAGVLLASTLESSGTIASWNLGAVYKPQHNGSIYIAYGNSLTPPGSTNLTLSATSSNIANAAFKPTETDNLEVGTKWDLLHKHLNLTAAWYDTVAKNELTLQDPVSLTYSQTGEREVTGIELGLVGQFSPKWSASAGIQTLHTEIKKGTTGNNANGAATRWSPDLTATVWTAYRATERFTLGLGAAYTSDQKLVVDPNATAQTVGLAKIPAFTVVNAMASYDLSRRVAVQLNLYNVFDEDYIQSLNNGGARVFPGQPQTATLTLNVKF